jgi:hypothetical protein
MIMSRRIRWVGHMARMRQKTDTYRILVGEPEGNNYENLDVGGRLLK